LNDALVEAKRREETGMSESLLENNACREACLQIGLNMMYMYSEKP